MILTVCPNPSIDRTIEVDSLNVGSLNRIDSKVETYSGKALNVAIGIARLGEACTTTGFMFENHKHMFEYTLSKEGVEHKFVLNPGSARVNYKIIDKRSMLTEINDKGEEISRQKQLELLENIKKLSEGMETVVISGSLPKGVSPSFYGEMVSSVWEGAKIIVDTEKENMLEALKVRKIFMAKPNVHELEDFSGIAVTSKKDMVRASKKYLELGAENVLISMGADGAVLTDGVESWYCKSASVAVNSTVGAGDASIAGFLYAAMHDEGADACLRYAVALGTAACLRDGTRPPERETFERILSQVEVREKQLK